MRTVLICHVGAPLDREGLARWLASFSELAGVIVLKERNKRRFRRISREVQRVGFFRFLDVLAFRLFDKIFHRRFDSKWERKELAKLCQRYPEIPLKSLILEADSPNSPEAEAFLHSTKPDILIARCKTLLKERIYSLASTGTFVFHPGICPEYRNAHGCFWALANRDLNNVGMTLLRVDSGVDTGPVYGHFSYPFDEVKESHHIVQQRVVFENLDKIKHRLLEIHAGQANPQDVRGRPSMMWGQPWLSSYLRWKRDDRKRRRNESHHDSIS